MNNLAKTKKQLIAELEQLKQRNAILEEMSAPAVTETKGADNYSRLIQLHDDLLVSKERYRLLFEKMTEGFAAAEIILNEQGEPADFRFLEVNPAAEQLTGIRSEGAVGKTARETFPRLGQEWINIFGKVALTGEPVTFEQYSQLLEKWFYILAFSPEKGKFACFFVDVTKRKHNEDMLREREQKYRNLFESIDEGFCIIEVLFDANGKPLDYRFLETNPAFAGQTGLHDAVGKCMRELEPQHEEHWFQTFGRIAMTGKSERFVKEAKHLNNRWYDVYAFRIGNTEERKVAVLFKNISERKRNEEALRKSEERWRKWFEDDLTGDAIVDIEGTIRDCNPALIALFGYENKSELLGKHISLLYADGTAGWESLRSRLAVTPRIVNVEMRGRRKDGTIIYLIKNARAVTDPQQNITTVKLYLFDITERMRTQKALKQNEERLRLALEAARMGTWERDLSSSGRAIWNDEECRILGYEPGQVTPGYQAWMARVHPEDLAAVQSQMHQSIGSCSEFTIDYRLLWPDGSVHWVEARGRFKCDESGKAIRSYGVLIDITERKEAEASLRTSEQKYRSLFEAVEQGVVYRNAAGELIGANPAAERIFGLSLAEMLGTRLTESSFRVIREDGAPINHEEYPGMKALRTGEVVNDVILGIFNPKENDYRWVMVDSIPQIRAGEKRPEGLFSVFSDITELKRSQAALQQLNDELEERIQERTAALRKSEGHLRKLSSQLLEAQENERKRVANEIHDNVGQVLAAIKYRVESAYMRLQKTGVAEALQPVKDLIPTIQTCITDMRRLYMELRPTILDDMGVAAAIEWFCREFETTYPSITLTRSLLVNEAELPEQLKLVIFRIAQEALNNAGKHSGASHVQIVLEKQEGMLRLQVEDNGCGFDLEEAQKIDTFGKGLGLSSMRERVLYSGGTLKIESAPGQGTRIETRWPKKVLV
ncbi:MAG TPA: PAS domain S-box protein [Thermodesulfobacteriota bacterium]|nr:PAS domain S-box protein [Thermodesulfobacteriota bacterium]